MFPGFDVATGGGGFSGSSSAQATAGPVTVGGFTFAPKASTLPTVAWVALGALAVALILKRR